MIRVKLDIPVYKRHKVTRHCFDGVLRIKQLFAKLGVELIPCVATDDDEHDRICIEYGFHFWRIRPMPLGARLNELMQCGPVEWDYHMGLGSDDFIADELVYILAGWLKANEPIFGVSSMYAVNQYTGEVKRVSQKLVFGSARFIRRDLIEKTGDLWEDNVTIGNDGNSQTRILRATGHGCKTVGTPRPMLFDVKGNVNLMKWDRFERYPTVRLESFPVELEHYISKP